MSPDPIPASEELRPSDPILGLMPKAHDRGGALVRPVDMAKVKGRSVMAMEEQVNAQLQQIYQQVETLAEQARGLQARAGISYRIYKAAIGFEPNINGTYYLYEGRQGKPDWLSLVSPAEFKGRQTHLATVKMLHDHTWDILDNKTSHADPTERNGGDDGNVAADI